MSISRILDDLLRDSLIGRYIPVLKRSPTLYRIVMGVREFLLPEKSACALARYQTRAVDRFCRAIGAEISQADILEVASDAQGGVAQELLQRGAREVTGINPFLPVWQTSASEQIKLTENCVIMKRDARATGFQADQFSHIFSVAGFEHIQDLDNALLEMHRILKPGGILYADINPIWSAGVGHHVDARVPGEEALHWNPKKNPIPDHGHLLYSQEEMEALIAPHVSRALKAEILQWVYHGTGVNRLFYEDYVRIVGDSPFQIEKWSDTTEYVAKTIRTKLQTLYPEPRRFDVRGIELILRKPFSG